MRGPNLLCGAALLTLPQRGYGFTLPRVPSVRSCGLQQCSSGGASAVSRDGCSLVHAARHARVFRDISCAQSARSKRRRAARLTMFSTDPATALTLAGGGVDVSAWSVTSLTSDLGAELFQASLAPYLAFLFFLSRKETKTPDGGLFGFAFLLVFVAATIPAGILAKTQYNDILANVDYLHGLAESFLTITNLLIVAAFRKAVVDRETTTSDGVAPNETVMRSGVMTTLLAAAAAGPLLLGALHPEPSNALSFPTWMVHVSSLIEWLAAMTYVWRYADVSGIKEWKGLTWGMLPLHTSGLIACTYHIFFNSPQLVSLVAMQAGLTCFGNSTMAYATWRVWQAGKKTWAGEERNTAEAAALKGRASSWTDDVPFYAQVLGITVAAAAIVKWGELLFDFPFEPSYAAAAFLILGPTALNAKKWWDRSANPYAPIEGIL